jgi:hypothetical protein
MMAVPSAMPSPSAPGLSNSALRPLQRAARALREAGPGMPAETLAWRELMSWPEWAGELDDAAWRHLALCTAALSQAEAIAQCIDGTRLQAARALLGDAALQRVAAHAEEHPGARPAAALPPAEDLARYWLRQGAACMLASVPSPALRAALTAHLRQRHALDASLSPVHAPCAEALAWLDAAKALCAQSPAQTPAHAPAQTPAPAPTTVASGEGSP